MAKWQSWQPISTGPYLDKPVVSNAGHHSSGYSYSIRDRAGNVVTWFPAVPGATGGEFRLAGSSKIAHLPNSQSQAFGEFATGTDRRLYRTVSNEQGVAEQWRKVDGPGQLLGEVWSLHGHDGSSEIIGEGTEHQLAHAYVTLEQNRNNTVTQWESLGQPGTVGGPKGVNGRPACVRDRAMGVHVLVRGQDNHLWHIHGRRSGRQPGLSFGDWTNLGGGLSQAPVAVGANDRIECFVVGEKQELYVKTWDGKRWSGFTKLGRMKVQGVPAAISSYVTDTTFVFARSHDNKLWYGRRTGQTWQRWQSVGEELTGDPAVWEQPTSRGGTVVTCLCLRKNSALWARDLRLTKSEYHGKSSPLPPSPPKKYTSYRIKSGDTLGAIAKKFGVSLAELKRLNQITNVHVIKAGDTLRVPVRKRGFSKQ